MEFQPQLISRHQEFLVSASSAHPVIAPKAAPVRPPMWADSPRQRTAARAVPQIMEKSGFRDTVTAIIGQKAQVLDNAEAFDFMASISK